jgi:diamine N-acetyltransferase
MMLMRGKNISLRAIEPGDIDVLYQWENDPEVWHLSNTLTPYSRFVLEEYLVSAHQDIYTAKQLRLMIEWHPDGSRQHIPAGILDLFDFEPYHRRAGIGILIANEFRLKGIGTEALQILTTYCFEKLNMHQIYCNIERDNFESISLFEKQGFVKCGTKKEWLWRQGWVDEIMFQMLRPEKEKQGEG